MDKLNLPDAVAMALDAVLAAPIREDEEDYGYAEGDTTSVWIERTGEKRFV